MDFRRVRQCWALAMDGDWVAIARMHQQHARFLSLEINTLHRDHALDRAERDALRQENTTLKVESAQLRQRIEELTGKPDAGSDPDLPAFVKANVAERKRRRPGRSPGHPASLRPPPYTIDVKLEIPLPVDARGKRCCPHCRSQLGEVKHHRRIVEDIIPSKVATACYHTHSGYCPSCRRRIETRAEDQPPAANLPHAQLGLNALATAGVMRVCYRMPLRQITQLCQDLPGLTLSPGAVSKQLGRLSRWLSGEYDRRQHHAHRTTTGPRRSLHH